MTQKKTIIIELKSDTKEIDILAQVSIKRIVNISSAPTKFVIDTLQEVMKNNKQIVVCRIVPNIMITEDMKLVSLSRKTPVWYVTDMDDINRNIKIRNINKVNGYIKIGMIEFAKEPSLTGDQRITGKETRVISSQTLRDTSRRLGCNRTINLVESNALNIVRIKTTVLDHIAGLTVMANKYNLPFVITENEYDKIPSWTMIKMTDYENINVDNSVVPDFSKDKMWCYTVEGTQYVTTERKIRKFSTIKKMDTEEKIEMKMKGAIESIFDLMVHYIMIVIRKITSFSNWCYTVLTNIGKKQDNRIDKPTKKKNRRKTMMKTK